MPGILYLATRHGEVVWPTWFWTTLNVTMPLMLLAALFMAVTIICDALGVELPW